MAVRNFWLEADIDGRKTRLTGGPVSKNGGFSLRIYMRDKGEITLPVYVEGTSDGEKLSLSVEPWGQEGYLKETER